MRAYPRYRDSGVEWLGDVPDHWDVTRLRDVAELINGFPFDSDLFDPSEGIPLVRIRDLFTLATEVKWSGSPVPSAQIANGDVLIGMDGDFNVAWWTHGPALLNQRLCCARALLDHASQRYLFYCLPFPLKALNDVTYATTVKHLSSLDVLKFLLPLPPLDEQRAIAAYLDRETERIDALVAKKRLLIERLEEYRTALITRTVTRGLPPEAARAAGLDPSPRLKPSGVEWLGEVPEHWEVKDLKRCVPGVTVGIVVTPAKYYEDEGVPCLRSLNVLPGKLTATDLVHISEESNRLHRKSMIFQHDIVVVRSGRPGSAAVVDGRFDGANAIDLIIIRQSDQIRSDFLVYTFESELISRQIALGREGSVQEHFNIESTRQLCSRSTATRRAAQNCRPSRYRAERSSTGDGLCPTRHRTAAGVPDCAHHGGGHREGRRARIITHAKRTDGTSSP